LQSGDPKPKIRKPEFNSPKSTLSHGAIAIIALQFWLQKDASNTPKAGRASRIEIESF
jgi:hypothetical protein